MVAISSEGHFRGSAEIEKQLVYVVQTDDGQETLPPEEFAEKYGWRNNPDTVHLDMKANDVTNPNQYPQNPAS